MEENRMSERKFITCKANDHDTANAHYRDCQTRGVPYIVVSAKRIHASVEWDHYSLPSDSDDVLLAHDDQIVSQIRDVFMRHHGPKSRYAIGALTGSFERFDAASAEAAAAEIYDILTGCLAAEA
jgi:hypothetical protein